MDIDRVIVYNGVTRYVLATVRRLFCFGSIKIEAFRFYAVNSQYSWYKILQSVTAIVSMPTFDKKLGVYGLGLLIDPVPCEFVLMTYSTVRSSLSDGGPPKFSVVHVVFSFP